jgi:hypothetical protein
LHIAPIVPGEAAESPIACHCEEQGDGTSPIDLRAASRLEIASLRST